jgi:hypothetical protein
MADKMRPKAATPVRATTHADTRSNIPTAEVESFARPEEKRPAIVRYPRDPSLDPQPVWKGKDEQDAPDLGKRALTNLCDPRPTVLDRAPLDAAVFAAYGWAADLPEPEILERLLALNLKRAPSPASEASGK